MKFKNLKKQNLAPLFFQSLGRLSSQALGFVLGVIIVRLLGIEIMGQYAKYTSLINITFGVLAAGIHTNYLRSNNSRLLGETLYGVTVWMLLFLVIFAPLYAYFFDDNVLNIVLILLSIYFTKLSEVFVVTKRFLNNDKKSILTRTIPYIIIIISCLFIRPDNISIFLLIVSLGWFSVVYFYFTIKEKIVLQKFSFKKIISSSILLSITTLATQIYANFDQLMIAELLSYEKLGVYKIAVSFSVLAMPLIGVFSFIYISEIKQYMSNASLGIFKRKLNTQIKINFLVSFLFFIFCLLFLRPIILLVYGISDLDASRAGVILSIGVIFNVISVVYSLSLLVINKDKIVLTITLIGALINIVLNYFFILKFGILGAAITSSVTQLIVLMLFIYVFYFKLNFFNLIHKIK